MAVRRSARRLGAAREGALAWAWAANGGASVVSTLLATVLALAAGYRAVLWLGAGCYLLAAPCQWAAAAADDVTAPGAPAAQRSRR